MKGPRKIFITIGDNDFTYGTLKPFLELLVTNSRIKWEEITREQIIELFRRSASGIYWICQNGLTYNQEWIPEEYFNNKIKVYFEGDTIPGFDFGNGEFAILDRSDIERPYIYIW